MTATTDEQLPAPSDSWAAFTQRMAEAGAPPLPGGLVYMVQYVTHNEDRLRVILDVRDMGRRKLLASQEGFFPRADVRVKDFVGLAEACCEQMTLEAKLPRAVRELLVGVDG